METQQVEMDDSGCVQDESLSSKRMWEERGLLDLSDDVLLHVLQYLDACDLKALGFTCPRFGALVLDRSLWRRVDARRLPCGRARFRWLVERGLHEATAALQLRGAALEARGCQGHKDNERSEQPSSQNYTSFAVPKSQEGAARAAPARPVRQPAQFYIRSSSSRQLPRNMAHPYWPDRRDVLPHASGKPHFSTAHCLGSQLCFTLGSLRRLVEKCPNLTTLGLDYGVIDARTTDLSHFPRSLTSLSLRGTKCYNITNNKTMLFRINDHLPNLEHVDVSECEWLEPSALLPLSKLPKLRSLFARDCLRLSEFVAYASLATMRGFYELETLDLTGCPLGDTEAASFGWLQQLESLALGAGGRCGAVPAHHHYRREPFVDYDHLEDWEREEPPWYTTSPEELDSDPEPEQELEPTAAPASPLEDTHVFTITFDRDNGPRVTHDVLQGHLLGMGNPRGNENAAPGNENPSPDNENASPENENASPDNENASPENENASPENENASPDNENASPDNENSSPENENASPDNENASPDNENSSPENENASPDNENASPDNENSSPDNENASPDNEMAVSGNEIAVAENLNVDTGNEHAVSGNENAVARKDNAEAGNENSIAKNENAEDENKTAADNNNETVKVVDENDETIETVTKDKSSVGSENTAAESENEKCILNSDVEIDKVPKNDKAPVGSKENEDMDPENDNSTESNQSTSSVSNDRSNYSGNEFNYDENVPRNEVTTRNNGILYDVREYEFDEDDDSFNNFSPIRESSMDLDEPVAGPSGACHQYVPKNDQNGQFFPESDESNSKNYENSSDSRQSESQNGKNISENLPGPSCALRNEMAESSKNGQNPLKRLADRDSEKSPKKPKVEMQKSVRFRRNLPPVVVLRDPNRPDVEIIQDLPMHELKMDIADNQPNPAENQPNPAENQPNPTENQQNPAENQPDPAENEPNPAENEPNPADNHQNPAENEPNPAEDQQNPVMFYFNVGEGEQRNRAMRLPFIRNIVFAPPVPRATPSSLITDNAILGYGVSEVLNVVRIGQNRLVLGLHDTDKPSKSKLKRLQCTGYSGITDMSLDHLLYAAPQLEYINFSETNVTAEGVERFRLLKPNCEVVYSKFVPK